MLKCVSTAQARTKCGVVLGSGPRHFSVKFCMKWLLWNVEVHFDCAGSQKVWSSVLGSVLLLHIMIPHIIIIIVVIIIIIIIVSIIIIINNNNIIIHYPPTPHRLFGASCRDNCIKPVQFWEHSFEDPKCGFCWAVELFNLVRVCT